MERPMLATMIASAGLVAGQTAAAGPAITLQEAQMLPLPELARRALGAAGAIVTDVDRPDPSACAGIPCPPPAEAPDTLPRLHSLTFYTRATAAFVDGWQGLCRATATHVAFDGNGIVTDLGQMPTIGWIGVLTRTIRRRDVADGPKIAQQFVESEARCSALPSTRRFVRVLDPSDGGIAFVAISLLHTSLSSNGPIRVQCMIRVPPFRCGRGDLRNLADAVTIDKISGISAYQEQPGRRGSPEIRCYSISLAHSPFQADLIETCVRPGRTLTITKAVFRRGPVVE